MRKLRSGEEKPLTPSESQTITGWRGGVGFSPPAHEAAMPFRPLSCSSHESVKHSPPVTAQKAALVHWTVQSHTQACQAGPLAKALSFKKFNSPTTLQLREEDDGSATHLDIHCVPGSVPGMGAPRRRNPQVLACKEAHCPGRGRQLGTQSARSGSGDAHQQRTWTTYLEAWADCPPRRGKGGTGSPLGLKERGVNQRGPSS